MKVTFQIIASRLVASDFVSAIQRQPVTTVDSLAFPKEDGFYHHSKKSSFNEPDIHYCFVRNGKQMTIGLGDHVHVTLSDADEPEVFDECLKGLGFSIRGGISGSGTHLIRLSDSESTKCNSGGFGCYFPVYFRMGPVEEAFPDKQSAEVCMRRALAGLGSNELNWNIVQGKTPTLHPRLVESIEYIFSPVAAQDLIRDTIALWQTLKTEDRLRKQIDR